MTKKIIFIHIFFFTIISIFAQTNPANKKADIFFKKALTYYYSGDTIRTLQMCDKSIQKDPKYTEPYVLKAQIYSEKKQYNSATELLLKVLSISPDYTQIYYILGLYYFRAEDYETSKKYLLEYISRQPDKNEHKKAHRIISIIDFRIYAIENQVEFEPIKLPEQINTSEKEYFPSVSADNKAIFFTRLIKNENGETQEDIYVSYFDQNEWINAKSLGIQINTPNNEGAHTISADGTFIIFTRCTQNESCNLFCSQKDESGFWLPPVELPAPVNSRYWDTQPSLTPDGKTLYFTSNRPGGKGKMDIWVTKYSGNGKWSKPKNLDTNINTEGNEMSPFIHFDKKTLYFTSDFFPGMGKFDIFCSKKDTIGNWSKPINLGFPINTEADEYRLVIDPLGEKAFFSSEREYKNQHDIYYFELPEHLKPTPTIYLRSQIFRTIDYLPINADIISVINLKTSDTLYFMQNTQKFTACMPETGEYALNILKKDYLFYSENFIVDKITDSIKFYDFNIYLNPIIINENVKLKNTFFDTDSYTINPKSYVELNKLAEFLILNPTVEIEIAGHTDNIGTYEYNIELSKKRALAIRDFLISKNISPDRMSAVGYGYTKPLADNQTEEGRKLNRRTEIVILKK